jgi:tripartite-type tricarboxylate transporter receptor subunit TctC
MTEQSKYVLDLAIVALHGAISISGAQVWPPVANHSREGAMTLSRRQLLHLAVAAVPLPALWRIAEAQAYPARPVRVIVPYAAGGPLDIFARLAAQKLSEHLAKQFYVENIGGAGGNIGMGQGAKAAPDGYTILVVSPSLVINPILYDKVPYDPYKHFDAVTVAVTAPSILVVHPSLPVHTVKDLVDFIRSHPGKCTFASPGTGTVSHLTGEQFRLSLGLDLVHVPFSSAGPAIGSTIAGHTPIAIVGVAGAVPQIMDGKLRALAVTSQTRLEALRDVPHMAEAGYPELQASPWLAIVVPARTPEDIITLLNREFVKVLALTDIKQRLVMLGFGPVGSTPEECAAQFRTDSVRWAKVIREAGIRAE